MDKMLGTGIRVIELNLFYQLSYTEEKEILSKRLNIYMAQKWTSNKQNTFSHISCKGGRKWHQQILNQEQKKHADKF